MEKLKEIFHKLKTTEINLKDIKLSSIKDKFSNLKNMKKEKTNDNVKYDLSLQNLKNIKKLKNITLNDIKTFDYRTFYHRHKQQILTIFVAFMAVFFLFYWTSVFLNSELSSSKAQADNTYKRLENVANMAGQIQFAKSIMERPENMQELTKLISIECGKEMRVKLLDNQDAILQQKVREEKNPINDLDIPINVIDE